MSPSDSGREAESIFDEPPSLSRERKSLSGEAYCSMRGAKASPERLSVP
jgi:hypothetical protein